MFNEFRLIVNFVGKSYCMSSDFRIFKNGLDLFTHYKLLETVNKTKDTGLKISVNLLSKHPYTACELLLCKDTYAWVFLFLFLFFWVFFAHCFHIMLFKYELF